MESIFKAYDIRGIYGDTLTDTLATDIGRAFAVFTGCRKLAVGRDLRVHSEALLAALSRGLTEQGVDVIDLGACSTPMCYFANGHLECDAGIMITASHNPPEYNGFKLARAGAEPISGDTGIRDIEDLVGRRAFAAPAATPGRVTSFDIAPAYRSHIQGAAAPGLKPLRIAADMANAMGIFEARALEGRLEIDALFGEPDGTCPNHEANPLKTETLQALQAQVRRGGYAFGVAFDGDADRVGFVDEKGDIVPMDFITALIAQVLLSNQAEGVVLYDLRSSRAVRETIEAAGGRAVMCRVGHAFIKQQMRAHDALFAGELSGHYYFRDNYFAESAALAVLSVANIVSREGRPLSELLAPLRRYVASGEINSRVADPAAALERVRARFGRNRMVELDGVSVELDTAWFNVRASNTEPLVRLNLEARSAEEMARMRDEVLALIRD